MEQTLVLIKPNAVLDRNIGRIITIFEDKDFLIKTMRMETLSRECISSFYAIHKDKEFFERLVKFMASGPVVIMLIEGEDCIARVRRLAGATNPSEAEPGTIRKLYAKNVTENAIHASDSKENAEQEIEFMFGQFKKEE